MLHKNRISHRWWSTWVARCHSAWDVEGIFPPLDGDMAMYNTWNAFYIERMPKICSSNRRGVVMVGPGGFAKFTFTAARSVIVTQSYNDKHESTIRLVTYLKNGFPRKMNTWRERGLNVVPDHSYRVPNFITIWVMPNGQQEERSFVINATNKIWSRITYSSKCDDMW